MDRLKQLLNGAEPKSSLSLIHELEKEWCYLHNLVPTTLNNISDICMQLYYLYLVLIIRKAPSFLLHLFALIFYNNFHLYLKIIFILQMKMRSVQSIVLDPCFCKWQILCRHIMTLMTLNTLVLYSLNHIPLILSMKILNLLIGANALLYHLSLQMTFKYLIFLRNL